MSRDGTRGERRADARLLVFMPARRTWPGGTRAAIGPGTIVPYLDLRADGTVDQGVAPIGRLPRARAIELVFDCLDVYTATVAAPRLNDARMRQALPNLLEERMLADTADCHFAWTAARVASPGPAAAGGANSLLANSNPEPTANAGWQSVAAIERTTLARTLEAFAQAQLQPRAAYSEIYTLAQPREGTFFARVDGGRGVLRAGLDRACAFDMDGGAAGTLTLARQQLGIVRLVVYGPEARALEALAQELGIAFEEAGPAIDEDALADAVNLLQGSFASIGGYGFLGRALAGLRRDGSWRAPAAWAGVCTAIAVVGLNSYWMKLDAQYQGVRASMRHAFRDAFPGESTIIDELAQARRSVATLRARSGRPSADDFSVLNARALQIFAGAPMGVVAVIEYSEGGYVMHCKPGSIDDPGLRNSLQARALLQGIALHFDADGAVRLAPVGS
jgi:general secretion pathway protein L